MRLLHMARLFCGIEGGDKDAYVNFELQAALDFAPM